MREKKEVVRKNVLLSVRMSERSMKQLQEKLDQYNQANPEGKPMRMSGYIRMRLSDSQTAPVWKDLYYQLETMKNEFYQALELLGYNPGTMKSFASLMEEMEKTMGTIRVQMEKEVMTAGDDDIETH